MTTTNTSNNDRYFENETPVLLKIKGGEVRFYKEGQRLAFSKKPWFDAEGIERIGKTVTINLRSNRGNKELIDILEAAIEDLKGGEGE